MSADGYIRVHRKMLDNWIMQDPQTLQVWIYLLLRASHKKHSTIINGTVVNMKRGELIFGRKKCATFLEISERNVRTAIKRLEMTNMIAKRLSGKSTKSASVISIINWDTYQTLRVASDQGDTVANDQESDQLGDQEATKKRPRSDQEATTIQEWKKGKKGRSITTCPEQSQAIPSEPSVVELPTNRKDVLFPITQSRIDELQKIYPSANVRHEFNKMYGWLVANPKRRKTTAGMMNFVNKWISKAHDESGISHQQKQFPQRIQRSGFDKNEYSEVF